MTYEKRIMCDGTDVTVEGRVLHFTSSDVTDEQVEAVLASVREIEEQPPEPSVDYHIEYEKVVVEKAGLVAQVAAAAADMKKYEAVSADVKKYEAMKAAIAAIAAIDPKAAKEDIVRELEAAKAMTADVKPIEEKPVEEKPLEEPIEKVG